MMTRKLKLVVPLFFSMLTLVEGLIACGQTFKSNLAASYQGTFNGPAILVPDRSKTPGALCSTDDPDFEELRYPARIAYCKRNVDESKKAEVAANYRVPKEDWDQYEFDHFIPLSIGGNDSIDNIWPQRLDSAKRKDQLEDELFHQLSQGQISQSEAVRKIKAWVND